MTPKSLHDWLIWQEALNPAEIDLGLNRIRRVLSRLQLSIPIGAVFVVAGTNGKGSCSAALEYLLGASGRRVGLYQSPHLVHYNERIRVAGKLATDAEIVAAFECIEAVRGDTPLTFFEFGTLAALSIFSTRECDAWVLEVGLGGRLDAVNAIDADFSVITTIGLDHQDWLGDSIEQIAAEKAGVLRAGRPAFYGDTVVPANLNELAVDSGAELHWLGKDFDYELCSDRWIWRGKTTIVDGLALPPAAGEDQLRNLSSALAAAEAYDPAILNDRASVKKLAQAAQLPGRFQVHEDQHRWIFDVAHNPQAAKALSKKLAAETCSSLTIVLAMQEGKNAVAFVSELAPLAQRWITCATQGYRGRSAAELAAEIESALISPVVAEESINAALEAARQETEPGGCILVCGSFLLVGPALEALGLY